jgi:hypothetical protein
MADNLKPSKTNNKEFFAIVRKDLVRANIDDLHEKSPRVGVASILFRADISTYEILDYQ